MKRFFRQCRRPLARPRRGWVAVDATPTRLTSRAQRRPFFVPHFFTRASAVRDAASLARGYPIAEIRLYRNRWRVRRSIAFHSLFADDGVDDGVKSSRAG